jgi:FMN-dependent NADH-azoreductase
MATILHIDSSPRSDRSKSRKLAKEFVQGLSEAESKIQDLVDRW